MSILRNMLEKDMTLKGLSYYKKCWNLEVENAKVVQGSSHDVMGAVAFLMLQGGQINDNNTSISLPATILNYNIIKILIHK